MPCPSCKTLASTLALKISSSTAAAKPIEPARNKYLRAGFSPVMSAARVKTALKLAYFKAAFLSSLYSQKPMPATTSIIMPVSRFFSNFPLRSAGASGE